MIGLDAHAPVAGVSSSGNEHVMLLRMSFALGNECSHGCVAVNTAQVKRPRSVKFMCCVTLLLRMGIVLGERVQSRLRSSEHCPDKAT